MTTNEVLAGLLAAFSDEFAPAQLGTLAANAKREGYYDDNATVEQIVTATREYHMDSGDEGEAILSSSRSSGNLA